MIRNRNRKFVLATRPTGMPKESDFRLVEEAMPEPGDGELLVRVLYLSLDPYMRGRMRDAPSYVPPVGIGEVMTGGVVGEVLRSNDPDFATGEIVEGLLGWQEYAVSGGKGLRRIDPAAAPVSTALGILGMPGLTAYFGLLDVGRPEAGDTVVVSAGAGAVGAVVGQIAKIKGCRSVGIVGAQAKVDYIVGELGFDAGIDYRAGDDLDAALDKACPKGIDIYFDNVGGEITDAVFSHLATGARIVICGQISQYNLVRPEVGPRLLWPFIAKRLRMQGFLVFDFAERYPEGLEQLTRWLQVGKLKYKEDIVEGIENAPRAFLGLFNGKNLGKRLVRIADEPA